MRRPFGAERPSCAAESSNSACAQVVRPRRAGSPCPGNGLVAPPAPGRCFGPSAWLLTVDPLERLPAECGDRLAGDRPAQVVAAQRRALELHAAQVALQATAHGLDLGEFRHGSSRCTFPPRPQ